MKKVCFVLSFLSTPSMGKHKITKNVSWYFNIMQLQSSCALVPIWNSYSYRPNNIPITYFYRRFSIWTFLISLFLDQKHSLWKVQGDLCPFGQTWSDCQYSGVTIFPRSRHQLKSWDGVEVDRYFGKNIFTFYIFQCELFFRSQAINGTNYRLQLFTIRVCTSRLWEEIRRWLGSVCLQTRNLGTKLRPLPGRINCHRDGMPEM